MVRRFTIAAGGGVGFGRNKEKLHTTSAAEKSRRSYF